MSSAPVSPCGDEQAVNALLSWRKSLLIAAGVLICAYAAYVLWYVHDFPDIGLRCMFSPVVQRVHDGYVQSSDGQPPPNLEGYTITQVGTYPVKVWPDLLRALIDLDRDDNPPTVDHLADAGDRTFVRIGPEDFVRVCLQKEGQSAIAVWCRLGQPPADVLLPSILWFFLNVGLFGVAAMLFWKRPTDRSAAQFFWLAIVTVGAYMGGYHWTRISTSAPLFVVYMVCSILLPAVSLHFYLVFPRTKRVLRRHPRALLLAIYGPTLAFWAVLVCGYLWLRWLVYTKADTASVTTAQKWLMAGTFIYLGVAVLLYLLSVTCLIHSYVTARDLRERQQVQWIVIGAVVALVPIGYSLYLAGWGRHDFAAGGATWPMFAASVCFTAAFTISLTRYRLMQLDQYMVYFLISFLFGLVYYALVLAGMLIVGSRFISGPSLQQALWVSSMALVLLLLLDLGRNRLRKVLDRNFHREKHQLDRTLQRLGQAIEQLVDPATLARRLLQSAADLLNVSQGAIYLREGEPPFYRLASQLGSAPALVELAPGCPLVDALQVRGSLTSRGGSPALDPARSQLRFLGGEIAHALVHEGRLLALLVLGPKVLGAYGPDDFNLLTAFAQMTALALENAEGHRTIEGLNRDLQAKVEKISEQQRRILALQSQLSRGSQGPASETREEAAVEANGQPTGALVSFPSGIVGSSLALRQLLQMVRKVAISPSEVLIRGESGTGKELLARAIHEHSPRADKPFIKVHCAALAPGLLESELFGHVKGAFTGAHRDKVGRFELANGGTLFLDEIGDINLEVQTKLLRVLEEMAFERVGSSDPVRVDVRLIAATHQNLEELMTEGRFREDLYYRLNVISIPMPPLRERREDIAELVQHFLRLYGQRCGKEAMQLDDDALALLKSYSWPGNIRQLENVVERAVVVAEDTTVTVRELPPELRQAIVSQEMPVPAEEPLAPRTGLRLERDQRDQRERERLVRALAAAAGNKAEAARALGLARSTLLSRLKKYGLS